MLEWIFILFLLFTSFYGGRSQGSERHTVSLSSHIWWGQVWIRLELCLSTKPGFCASSQLRWLASTHASVKRKQASLSWKSWLKSSVGMLCLLLSWILVWIKLYSLETMEISSTSHLRMQCQVRTANCCPLGRTVSQPVTRDLFTFLVSQWMWSLDRKPFVHRRKVLLEALGTCCVEGSVLGEKKCLKVWFYHSESRTRVPSLLCVDMKVLLYWPSTK